MRIANMFGDRVKKSHYLDKNGKRTTDIFEARVMTSGRKGKPVRKFTCKTEMMVALKPISCFASCNREKEIWDCWLIHYPKYRCKYRLTLPKE